MRILVANHSDGPGGAARAAYRLHRSYLANGQTSRMLVDIRTTDDPTVHAAGWPNRTVRELSRQVRARAQRPVLATQHTSDGATRSPGLVRGPAGNLLRWTQADLVNLHWVGGGYLSIGQIARVRKPLVWTLHDMWVFCGAEHYAPEGEGARWRTGYQRPNRPADARGLDVDAAIWKLKQQAWRRPLQLVAPSRWLARCAAQSELLSGWPCTVIPNALPLDVFRPHPISVARDALRLPHDVPLIAFGAPGGTRDPRKGWDLLAGALQLVAERVPKAQAVVFGQSRPSDPPRVGMPLHFVGRLADDVSLALVYGAADVMVVPSRQDNLPQTAVEAQSCGTPVVAFRTGGLADTLEDRVTGYLAEAFDVAELAHGITWVLDDPRPPANKARQRAEALWSPTTVARQYQGVFAGLVES